MSTDTEPSARRSRRSRLGALVVLAVLLTPFAIMPYFGLGADVSPNAHGHLQRRYGVVGMWLAGLWLAAMAVLIVAWIVKRLIAKRSDLVRSQRA